VVNVVCYVPFKIEYFSSTFYQSK